MRGPCSHCLAGGVIVFIDAVPVGRLRQDLARYSAVRGCGPPRAISVVGRSRSMPRVVVDLGELVGVMYRSGKGRRGPPRTYIHRMEDPPRLVSNASGTQLYIVGGSYRITPRGIEG